MNIQNVKIEKGNKIGRKFEKLVSNEIIEDLNFN